VCAYVITAHRARHHRFPSPPRTTGTPRALLRRRRSLARSRAEAEAVGLGVAFSYTARHARHARARERHHRASRASSPFFVPPCTTGTRALQRRRRSLDCARAVWRW